MESIERLASKVKRWQFNVRQGAWGAVKLRRGPPKLLEDPSELGFYSLVLKKAFTLAPDVFRRVDAVWDVGCRNWSYAGALAEAFPAARLVGVELDGRRRYWNLHRRMDYALAVSQALNLSGRRAECVFTDFRQVWSGGHEGDALTAYCFFFPFVSANPCLKWGLPLEYSDFKALVEHALSMTRMTSNQAVFISCHQGEWEAELALAAYCALGMAPRATSVSPVEARGLWPSPHETRVLVVEGAR